MTAHTLVTRMLSFKEGSHFDGYPTTTEQDIALIKGRSIDSLTRLAVAISHNREEFSNCMRYIKAFQDNIIACELAEGEPFESFTNDLELHENMIDTMRAVANETLCVLPDSGLNVLCQYTDGDAYTGIYQNVKTKQFAFVFIVYQGKSQDPFVLFREEHSSFIVAHHRMQIAMRDEYEGNKTLSESQAIQKFKPC